MIYYSMQYNQAYFHRVHFRTDLNFEQTYFDLSSDSYIKPQKKRRINKKGKKETKLHHLPLDESATSRAIDKIKGGNENGWGVSVEFIPGD